MTPNNSGPNPYFSAGGINLLFILTILLISLVLGGGLVWLYCDYRYENIIHRLKEESLKSQACEYEIDLYRNVEATVRDIVALTEKYQKELDSYFKGRSLHMDAKLIAIKEELIRAEQLYKVYEGKLVEIDRGFGGAP